MLPAIAGEDRVLVKSGLAFEVKFRGPPGRGAIFKLRPECMKVVATALGAEGGKALNLKISRLLQIMIIRDDVGSLLAPNRWSHQGESDKEGNPGKPADADREQNISLQIICNKKANPSPT